MEHLVEVFISSKVRRITLQRYLLGKIAWKEEFDEVDLGALYLNQVWLEQKTQRDKQFCAKFGSSLEELSIKMRELNLSSGLTAGVRSKLRSVALQLSQLTLPARNLPEVEKHVKGLYGLRTRSSPGVPKKMLPPKRFIGIGYRDKGTAKTPEVDGSPSWQEVATEHQNLGSEMRDLVDQILKRGEYEHSNFTGEERLQRAKRLAYVKLKLLSIERDPRRHKGQSTEVTRQESPEGTRRH